MYRAQYLGTVVAVKVLKDTNAVALGDFRSDKEASYTDVGYGSASKQSSDIAI